MKLKFLNFKLERMFGVEYKELIGIFWVFEYI